MEFLTFRRQVPLENVSEPGGWGWRTGFPPFRVPSPVVATGEEDKRLLGAQQIRPFPHLAAATASGTRPDGPRVRP